MAKFPLYQGKKGQGGNVDTTNLAKKNETNTFEANQNIRGTGDVLTLLRTNNQAHGVDLLNERNDRVAYFGTRENAANEATVGGKNKLVLQATAGNVETHTFNNDFQGNSNRTGNQNVDNTLVRTKDLKYVKKGNYTGSLVQPNNSGNQTSGNGTMDGINTDGIHEFLVCISTADNTLFTFNPKIMGKNGLSASHSSKFYLDKLDGGEDVFVFTIKTGNKLYISHKRISGQNNYSGARCGVVRNNNLPGKVNELG